MVDIYSISNQWYGYGRGYNGRTYHVEHGNLAYQEYRAPQPVISASICSVAYGCKKVDNKVKAP